MGCLSVLYSYFLLYFWQLVIAHDDDDDWLTGISIKFGSDDGDDKLLGAIDMVDGDGDAVVVTHDDDDDWLTDNSI